MLELRRYRRILYAGRLPIVYAIAIFAVAGMLIPFLFSEGGILAGPNPISREPGWGGGMLLTITALGAALGGYLRAQHLWQEQREMHTLHTWLLTQQWPGRAAFTTVVMGSLLGITLVAVPAIFGVVLALFGGINAGRLLLYALYLPLCAFFGSALGAVVFFVGQNLIPRPSIIRGSRASSGWRRLSGCAWKACSMVGLAAGKNTPAGLPRPSPCERRVLGWPASRRRSGEIVGSGRAWSCPSPGGWRSWLTGSCWERRASTSRSRWPSPATGGWRPIRI